MMNQIQDSRNTKKQEDPPIRLFPSGALPRVGTVSSNKPLSWYRVFCQATYANSPFLARRALQPLPPRSFAEPYFKPAKQERAVISCRASGFSQATRLPLQCASCVFLLSLHCRSTRRNSSCSCWPTCQSCPKLSC